MKALWPQSLIWLTGSNARRVDDASWNSDCNRSGWNVMQHHGVGANGSSVADKDLPEDDGACAYVDTPP
jgi:hypothetical protein